MAVSTIIDKRCLERWLYARYFSKIDISLKWPSSFNFDVEIFQPVPIDDQHAGLFRVRGID